MPVMELDDESALCVDSDNFSFWQGNVALES
jgi:hypothetical protein